MDFQMKVHQELLKSDKIRKLALPAVGWISDEAHPQQFVYEVKHITNFQEFFSESLIKNMCLITQILIDSTSIMEWLSVKWQWFTEGTSKN